MFDRISKEYIFDHGWRIDSAGFLVLSQKQFNSYQYSGKSIRDENIKTLMLPSIHGCCLVFEGKHFRIE